MADPKVTQEASHPAKFDPFNIIDIDYKIDNQTPISASILLPKTARPGKHPVTVRWHGGGFGTGHRLFPDWYPDWVLSLCHNTSAIVATPDYRLMPEAKGTDILQDSQDFYSWLFTPGHLAQHLPAGIEPDLDHVLVTGESAGGWHALQAGFLIPEKVAAVIAHYPMVDMRSKFFTQRYQKELLDPPIPQQDPAVLEHHVQKLQGDEVVSFRHFPDGFLNVVTMIQQGVFAKYFGTKTALYPLEMLAQVNDFPPLWVLHGTADSLVPVTGTELFVEQFKERLPNVPLHVTLESGEEHGFDNHNAKDGSPASLQTEWVKTGVEFISRYWPA